MHYPILTESQIYLGRVKNHALKCKKSQIEWLKIQEFGNRHIQPDSSNQSQIGCIAQLVDYMPFNQGFHVIYVWNPLSKLFHHNCHFKGLFNSIQNSISILCYNAVQKKRYKFCFMKQKCQLQMGTAKYKNAVTPLTTRAINTSTFI